MSKNTLIIAIIAICTMPLSAWAGINEGSYQIYQNGKEVISGKSIVTKHMKNETFKIKIVNNKTHEVIGLGSGTTLGNNPLMFDSIKETPYISSLSTKNNVTKSKQGFVESGYNFAIVENGATVHVVGNISKLDKIKKLKSGTSIIDKPYVNSVEFNQLLSMHSGQTVKFNNGPYSVTIIKKV
jgi:hypothetical protein